MNSEILTQTTMLSFLQIGLPGVQSKDTKITNDTKSLYSTSEDIGYFSKTKYSKKDVAKLNDVARRARQLRKDKTLPWDGEARLLPSKMFQDFITEITQLQTEYNVEKAAFKANIATIIQNAQNRLAPTGTFDIADYPTAGQIDDILYFEHKITPVPDSSNFASIKNLISDELEILEEEMEEENNKRFKQSMKTIFHRIYDVVVRVEKTLADPKKKFQKSMITNIEDLINILPQLNYAEDETLDEMVDELKDKICGVDIKELRENPIVRQQVATDAGKIKESADIYMEKFDKMD